MTVSSVDFPIPSQSWKPHFTDIVSVNAKIVHTIVSVCVEDKDAVVFTSESVDKVKKKLKECPVAPAAVPLCPGLFVSPFFGSPAAAPPITVSAKPSVIRAVPAAVVPVLVPVVKKQKKTVDSIMKKFLKGL